MRTGLYAGSTLLDDGQPVLLLDVANIAGQAKLVADARARALGPVAEADAAAAPAQRAMLFTDFAGRRAAVRLELVQRIETAPAAAIDRPDPQARQGRVVIDGAILPLVGLPAEPLAAPRVRLLRLSDGMCEVLYAVREVEDAVELTSALVPVPEDPLAEAVTLIGGRPVTIIDAHALFAAHGEPPRAAERPRCILPEGEWAQSILAPLVRAAGYDILAPGAHDPAAVGIVFEDVFEVAEALGHALPERVIRLRDHPEAPAGSASIYRYDREALLAALAAAAAPVAAAGEAA
jgi:two-component system chemotaxis sensor kinase CheA